MTNLFGINNYSDSYKEYGNKVLKESAEVLNKAGIQVFPWNTDDKPKDNETQSVVVRKEVPAADDKLPQKRDNKKTTNPAKWIRDAMPTSNDQMSLSSSMMNSCNTYLGKVSQIQSTQSSSDSQQPTGDDVEYFDAYDVKDVEDDATGIDTLSNANDDEGDGNLLQTFFEKDIKDGFSSDNFAGSKFKDDMTAGATDGKAVVYSDNLYHKNNTSVIFGGTANLSYHQDADSKNENFDYNVYSYGKYKAKDFTYGLGGMSTKTDGVNNINISVGSMHNSSKIYGILQKQIVIIPGLPTQTKTDIKVGIGDASGLLDPDAYNPKDKSIEEISEIDSASTYVEGKETDVPTDDVEKASKKGDLTVNLIIKDTDNDKEYGVKVGKVFRHASKNNNYSFIMPFAEVADINVDSNEGAKFLAGATAGQNISFNGWNIKTKGVVEASRTVITGSRPSDNLLANVNIKAGKNNFDSEIAAGMYVDNTSTYCRYVEAKVKYAVNSHLTAGIKAGLAKYNYDANDNKICEIAAGVHYTF